MFLRHCVIHSAVFETALRKYQNGEEISSLEKDILQKIHATTPSFKSNFLGSQPGLSVFLLISNVLHILSYIRKNVTINAIILKKPQQWDLNLPKNHWNKI